MAFNLESMTVDYKAMYSMIPSDRLTVAQSGIANDLISTLTPGQLSRLFPKYYMDRLPDIGQSSGGTSLGGALSGGTTFSSGSGGTAFPAAIGTVPSKTAQQLAVEQILKEKGIVAKSESTAIGGKEGQILATIKQRESQGNYSSENPAAGATASGAYQFIDSTWQSLTAKYGIGTEYTRAVHAPPEIQDAVAKEYVKEILKQNNGDVSKVPLVWYTGNAAGKISAAAIAKNGGLTPQQYQANWMKDFDKFANVAAIESSADEIKKLEDLKAELIPLSEEIRKKLDAKTLEIYDRGNPAEKWNIEHAINAVGVDKFNEQVQTIAKTTANVSDLASYDIPLAYDPKSGLPKKFSRHKNMDPRSDENMANITEVQTPYGKINVAKDAAAAFGGFYNELSSVGFPMKNSPGSFNIRQKRSAGPGHNPGTGWSEHSFGNATDIGNQTQLTKEQLDWMSANPGKFEQLKTKWGMRSPPGDDPHMEYMGAVSPEAQAQIIEAKKKSEEPPAVSDPVAAAQSNIQPPTSMPEQVPSSAVPPAVPAPTGITDDSPAVPALAAGGTVEMTPGENIAGVNTTTGKVEFMSNDRELYTKDDQGNLRVDPSTIKQNEPPVQPPQEPTQRLDTSQPLQSRTPTPVPQENPDPNFYATMTSGSMASSPSQLRALNRAKLYGDNSGNLVNGHFA